jgi:hypothetical protein
MSVLGYDNDSFILGHKEFRHLTGGEGKRLRAVYSSTAELLYSAALSHMAKEDKPYTEQQLKWRCYNISSHRKWSANNLVK